MCIYARIEKAMTQEEVPISQAQLAFESRVIGPLLERLVYICPSLRNVSIPRPSSCARPLRSAIVVIRSSEMI